MEGIPEDECFVAIGGEKQSKEADFYGLCRLMESICLMYPDEKCKTSKLTFKSCGVKLLRRS